MSERLFARLAARLVDGPVVLASVVATRGATPRKAGARMLVTAADSEASIGGGLAEARVLAAARALLAAEQREAALDIDLGGGPDAAGVCGGRMRIALRRWDGVADLQHARTLAAELAQGRAVALGARELGEGAQEQRERPNDRLLIVGAGHCGRALLELAAPLDFDLWIFDTELARLEGIAAPATRLAGGHERLCEALATTRRVHAVLLNRDFQADVATLRALASASAPPRFIGMMGSTRRIAQVRAAVPDFDRRFGHLRAPAGLEIGAQTPHEIAVSLLAQLVADRAREEPPAA